MSWSGAQWRLGTRAVRRSDEKIVAITFDDAYRSIYATAFPNLRARGWPFTIFVATRLVEEENPQYLTWAELAEMSRSRRHNRESHRQPHPYDPAS